MGQRSEGVCGITAQMLELFHDFQFRWLAFFRYLSRFLRSRFILRYMIVYRIRITQYRYFVCFVGV